MTQEKEILEFHAIPLWEVILSFVVMVFLILGITEYVIAPLTKGNTAIQTQLIILMCVLFLLLEFYFHIKRGKKLIISIDKQHVIEKISISNYVFHKNQINNLSTVKFIMKKSLSSTLIINNKMFLIYSKEALSLKPDKNTIILSHEKMSKLLNLIRFNNFKKNNVLEFIPLSINISFYLLLIISFLLFLFLFTAILTNNTQWFKYFK